MPQPTGQIYQLLFYGLHVCYAGVISKVSLNCSNGKYQGMGKHMFTKKCLILKNAQVEFVQVEALGSKMALRRGGGGGRV